MEQPDLTEHVFRSVRGWLHQLFPADAILIERRRDESLTPADAAAGRPTAPAPLWRETITAGPSWEEVTGYSHRVAMTIELLRRCTDNWDAVRTAGRVLANASRPAGRIPLYAYNLAFPQPPGVYALPDPGTLPALVDVAVAAVAATGQPATAPSIPVTVAPGSNAIRVVPANWPAGAPLATSFHVYAAAAGGPLTLQASIPPGGWIDLDALAIGTTTPTNLRAPLIGLRVDDVDALPSQLATEAEPVWEMRATLRLSVQVPRAMPAHLDAALLP